MGCTGCECCNTSTLEAERDALKVECRAIATLRAALEKLLDGATALMRANDPANAARWALQARIDETRAALAATVPAPSRAAIALAKVYGDPSLASEPSAREDIPLHEQQRHAYAMRVAEAVRAAVHSHLAAGFNDRGLPGPALDLAAIVAGVKP